MAMRILFSDHKPVSASFQFTVPVKDEEKYRKVQREVISDVDKSENELLPAISLSTQHVDFGDIRKRWNIFLWVGSRLWYTNYSNYTSVSFDESITRTIRLQNTGKVPALYKIKDSRESLLNRPGESKQMLRDMGIFVSPTKVLIFFLVLAFSYLIMLAYK